MRIAGAQIPVAREVSENFKTIMKACEWAVENNVDYLITPEASLSGYDAPGFTIHTCKETEEAMNKLVEYASKHKLGLIIGTLWMEDKDKLNGPFYGFKSNQLRFYNTEGKYIGSVKKSKIVSFDQDCEKGTDTPIITLTKGDEKLKIGALICNDLVGNYYWGGDNLARELAHEQVNLIIHCSNTQKDQGEYVKKIHDDFHDACLRFMAYATNCPILSVDNPWHIFGIETDVGTSFTSGIYLPLEALHQAPKTGTHYFYFDPQVIQKLNYQEG